MTAAKEAESIEEAREQITAAENVAEVANQIACARRSNLLQILGHYGRMRNKGRHYSKHVCS